MMWYWFYQDWLAFLHLVVGSLVFFCLLAWVIPQRKSVGYIPNAFDRPPPPQGSITRPPPSQYPPPPPNRGVMGIGATSRNYQEAQKIVEAMYEKEMAAQIEAFGTPGLEQRQR